MFARTNDLRNLPGGGPFVGGSSLIDAARYVAGPPISRDDLSSLADVPNSFAALDPAGANRVSLVLVPSTDRHRFPWLFETPVRAPTAEERRLAITATAVTWAGQLMATKRRTESSRRQENAVKKVLADLHYEEVPRRTIDRIDDLARGQFCPEASVAGTKCDVPVRLLNGGLLLIECKVSGSSINSFKRLNHETGDKRTTWNNAFGAQQFTMAVLAGVFRLTNLEDAQNNRHVYIVWERDLGPLADFINRSR